MKNLTKETMKIRNIFNKVTVAVTATIASLAIAVMFSGAVQMPWDVSAKASERPEYSVYFSKNSASAETTETLKDVKPGDEVHVFLSVHNPDEENKIDKLQLYAPFSHRGIFTWIKADDFGKQTSSNKPTIDLPNDQHIEYVSDSTQYATNVTGEWKVTKVDDYSTGNSKLFSDSSSKGFFLNDVEGGKLEDGAKVNYIVKYKVKIKEGNTALFNNHSTDDKTFMVRRRGDSEWKTSLDGFKDGERLEFRVYVHNNTRGTIAMNTKVGVENWPDGEAKERELIGFVDADNAERAKSTVKLTNSKKFKLDYKEKSTRFSGQPSMDQGFFLTDEVRPEGIISANGITIGEGSVGAVDGCWDFLVYAYFEAEVKEEDDDDDDDEACFEIRVWEDFNGNGRKDSGEPGLDWDSEWQYDNDSTWTAYKNYANKDGKGSKICTSKERKTRTRLVVKDWCKPTTPTHLEDTLEHGRTKLFEFGCRRDKPTVQKGSTPKQLPKTGSTGEILLGSAVGLLGTGAGLTVLRRRMHN